jgi:hypothetical protein
MVRCDCSSSYPQAGLRVDQQDYGGRDAPHKVERAEARQGVVGRGCGGGVLAVAKAE